MQADLPHTLYYKTDKDGNPVRKVDTEDKAISKQEEANRRARERRAKARGEAPMTMSEIFNE